MAYTSEYMVRDNLISLANFDLGDQWDWLAFYEVIRRCNAILLDLFMKRYELKVRNSGNNYVSNTFRWGARININPNAAL